MQSEMVERVAKAIENALCDKDGYLRKSYSEDDLIVIARAAIEAMREPTPQQITEGYGALLADSAKNGYDNRTDDKKLERMREFYRATIDAALTPSIPA